jgi:hypothetical protein
MQSPRCGEKVSPGLQALEAQALALEEVGMPPQRRTHLLVAELCRLAIEGMLALGEIHDRWPREADGSPFLRGVFEDLEDAVEHYPAEWVFAPLRLDLLLLKRGEDDRALLRCREALLQPALRVEERPETLIQRYFGDDPGG